MGINSEPGQMDMSSFGQDFSIGGEKPKTNSDRNYQRLKKYYGEAFVKSNDDDGEYGFNARSLGEFADFPDFADKLKVLIPNKHNALKTLRDNFDYINATLQKSYEVEGTAERVIKNPYELARRVGYELTGPFETAEEMDVYRKDFRDREEICTYKDPKARLKAYHIMWLRHKNADNILPADKLTVDNLSEEWKQYLREINRYDENSNTYNLTGIKPTREDPYGTSSMSVQIIRDGTFRSIKNRYNHTVPNPDYTLSNNLNRLTDGLMDSVFAKVGREDLIGSISADIADGYLVDNNGGLHSYYYEKDNVYYGDFEKVEGGEVKSLDRNEYYMLSPELYVGKNGGKVESFDSSIKEIKTERDGEILITRCYGEDNQLLMTYTLTTDEVTKKVLDLKLSIGAEGTTVGDISNNPTLTSLDIAGLHIFMNISNNPALTSLNIAEGAGVGKITDNPALTSLNIAEGADVGKITDNPALTSLNIPEGAVGGDISNNPALTSLNIAEGATVEDIYSNPALTSLKIVEGVNVGKITDNPSLTSLSIAKGVRVGGSIFNNSALTSLNIAEGVKVGNLSYNPSLTGLNIPKGATVGNIFLNLALTSLNIAEGATVGKIYNNHPKLQVKKEER